MIGENVTPAAGKTIAGGKNDSLFAAAFDLDRFGAEVANEIGVDTSKLGQYGRQRIQALETQTHSDTQQGGSR